MAYGDPYSIQLLGADELHERLEAIGRRLRTRVLVSAGRKSAEIVKNAAVPLAPRQRRGRIGRAIRVKIAHKDRRGVDMAVGIRPNARGWFGKFHEFGTRKMPARPFLRPALDANRAEVIAVFAAELEAALSGAEAALSGETTPAEGGAE